MERARWTDERLDREMEKIDRSFDRVIEELRAMRIELKDEISAIRADLAASQRQLTIIAMLFAVGLLGLLGAAAFGVG
jgi:alkylhydroperoxidase/carboxymuconolactone decarboxylase family protein YurZ